jgi:EmrB/QacA subfamily drug resistance transporter
LSLPQRTSFEKTIYGSPVPRRILIPVIVACALFMETLDMTVISTSLPQIAKSFGENPLKLSLAITSYLLSLAVFLPISGTVSDRFGSRTVFSAAIVIFTGSSVLCGHSDSILALSFARVLQGIGGAMMVPVGRLLILRSFEKREYVRAMSYFAIPGLIGPMVGPPLGGFITTYGSWRWIFYLNVPIGALGLVLVALFIPNLREEYVPKLDWKGWLLAGAALAFLLFGLENLGRGTLPLPVTLALVAAGLCFGFAYMRHSKRAPAPILDLSLLKIPTFWASIVGGLAIRIGSGAMQLLLPLMLQLSFGLSAFASGSITLATAAGAFSAKFFSQYVVRRFGFRRILVYNTVLAGLLLACFSFFGPTTPHLIIMLLLLVNGATLSTQFTALNGMGFSDLEGASVTTGSSLVAVAQQVSLALGVAVGALMLHLTTSFSGASGSAEPFHIAFLSLGLAMTTAALIFVRLPPDAGASVSGHSLERGRRAAAADGPALTEAASGADAAMPSAVAAEAELGKGTQPSGPKASSGLNRAL